MISDQKPIGGYFELELPQGSEYLNGAITMVDVNILFYSYLLKLQIDND